MRTIPNIKEVGRFDAVWVNHPQLRHPWVLVWKQDKNSLQVIEADGISKATATLWGVVDVQQAAFLKVNCFTGDPRAEKLFRITADVLHQRVVVLEETSGVCKERPVNVIEDSGYVARLKAS